MIAASNQTIIATIRGVNTMRMIALSISCYFASFVL